MATNTTEELWASAPQLRKTKIKSVSHKANFGLPSARPYSSGFSTSILNELLFPTSELAYIKLIKTAGWPTKWPVHITEFSLQFITYLVNCQQFTHFRPKYFPKHFMLHQMLQKHIPLLDEMTALEAFHSLNTVLFPCCLYRRAQRALVHLDVLFVALRPNAGHGLLILSRSHKTTHHSR
jgi:hypothetical protein